MAVYGLRLIVYLQVAYYCVYGTTLPLPSELEGNSEATMDTTTELSTTPEVSDTIGNIDSTTSISTRLSSSIPTTELSTTSVVSNTTPVEELSSTQPATVQSTLATTESTTSLTTVVSLPTDVSTAMTSSTSTNQSPSITTGMILSSSVSSTPSSSTLSQSQTTLGATTQSTTTISSTTAQSSTTQPPTTASSTTTQSPTTQSTSTTQPTTTSTSTTQPPTTTSTSTTQPTTTTSTSTTQPTTTTSTSTTQPTTTTSTSTTQPTTTTSTSTTQPTTTTSTSTTQSRTTTTSTSTTQPTTTTSSSTTQPTTTKSTSTTQSTTTTTSTSTKQPTTTTSSSTTQSTTRSSTTIQPPTTTPSSTTESSTTLLMTSPETQASSSLTPTQSTTSITPSTTTTQTAPVPTTQRKINFQISLNIDETRNLSKREEYAKVVDDSKNALTSLYTKQLGDKFSKVDIKSVRIGSLVIDHDVFVQNSPSALVDVVNLMKNISDGKTNVTYNGNDASALSVSYTDSSNNQVLIDDKTDPTTVIESSYVCNSDQSCERIPTTTKDSKEDILIIIISSVAGCVALLIIIAVVSTVCSRRKKPKEPVTTDRQYQHFLFSQQTTEILNKANNRQQSLGNESNTSRLKENYSGSHYAKLGRVPSRPPDSYGLYERAEDQKSREPDVFVTTPNTNNWGMPYVPPLDNGRGNNRNRGADQIDQNRKIYTSTEAVRDDKFQNNQAVPYRLGYNDRNPKNLTTQFISQGSRNSGYGSTLEATYLPNLETRHNETPVRRDNFQGPNYHSRENINSRQLQRNDRYGSKDRLGELNYRPPVGSRNQYYPGYDASRNPSRSDYDVRNPQTNSQPDLLKAGKRWYPGYDEYLAGLGQSRAGNPKYDASREKHYNARGKHYNAHY